MTHSFARKSPYPLAFVLGSILLGAAEPVRPCRAAESVDGQRQEPSPTTRDPRNIRTGSSIPDEGYCDQPYVVITRDGNWLCTLTTGRGKEGAKGQHVVSTISSDHGRNWSKLSDIEPSTGPEASWVVPLVVPGGRVYAFYTYNGDRIDQLRGNPIRADMLGWYVTKYSDDNGRSWSNERLRLPIRVTACDRHNDWSGKVAIFWGISKPIVANQSVLFSFTKLGRYMLEQGEGWLFRSDNLLAECDVGRLRWQMLPEGERGIRSERFGSVQEEHNVVSLGGDQLYCVYRTTDGFPCHTYSRDGGRTWQPPDPMTYTPGGRTIKTPRACPRIWRTSNGNYLFWFHNHGGRGFQDRNPAWVCGGVLREGRLWWSQPEILLYDPDPGVRMSYPDLIEQDGRYWITETQKTVARVHQIDRALVDGLWNQGQVTNEVRDGLVADWTPANSTAREIPLACPLDLGISGGLSLDLWIRFEKQVAEQVLLDSRKATGAGIRLLITAGGAVRLELADGRGLAAWDGDSGLLAPGKRHHIVAIVDAGPRILSFVIDGQLCDGGSDRQFGWGRYASDLGDVTGTGVLRLAATTGELERVRVYNRYLRTSEAVANYRAGF